MGVTVRPKGGKWFVFVNHNGRRKSKCIGEKKAAEQVKRVLEAKLALGDLGFLAAAEPTVSTFKEYAEKWLAQHAEIHCKPSTVASYRQLLRLYLYPKFGTVALDRISRESVKGFLAEMAAKEKTNRKEPAKDTTGTPSSPTEPVPLARNTLRLALSTLRVILNHAIDDGIIDRNPAARLGKFTATGKPKAQAQALTRKEVERFLEAAKEIYPEYYPLFLVAVRAGLRRGELVALRWSDIQFGQNEADTNRFILVQRNYVHGRFTSPKSKKSRRVDLSRQLRRVLIELRDKRLLEAQGKNRTSIEDDLVSPSDAGTVLDPDNLANHHFLPILAKAGLRKIRFHDLRHTFGSLLIQDGASLAYVKEQMGHSSIQVTVDVYGHLVPGANIAWVDRLDRMEEAAEPDAAEDSSSKPPVNPEPAN
jgi:integrase